MNKGKITRLAIRSSTKAWAFTALCTARNIHKNSQSTTRMNMQTITHFRGWPDVKFLFTYPSAKMRLKGSSQTFGPTGAVQ